MLKNAIKYLQKKYIILSVIAFCSYALYLRIVGLYQHTLWTDEIFQLNQMQGTFFDLLKSLQAGDFCSFLSGDHYLIYPFFKIFSYNKWGLAIPHIIATIIGFYILYLLCKRYFVSVWGYLITFSIVCFNATLIAHSTEIRPYAVLPTLALATFYLFGKIAGLNFNLNFNQRLYAIIFFILVIWFHVYGILMFGTCLLFWFLSKYREITTKGYFKNLLILAVTVLCIAMPLWLYSVFGPHLAVPTQVVKTFEFIPNPLHNTLGFLKSIFGNLIGFKSLYFLILGTFIPLFFSYPDRYRQLLFLSVIIIFPICFILSFDLARKYWFLQRQFIWVMPLYAFFLGWAWDSFLVMVKSRILKEYENKLKHNAKK